MMSESCMTKEGMFFGKRQEKRKPKVSVPFECAHGIGLHFNMMMKLKKVGNNEDDDSRLLHGCYKLRLECKQGTRYIQKQKGGIQCPKTNEQVLYFI